jgi:hypothetical protein
VFEGASDIMRGAFVSAEMLLLHVGAIKSSAIQDKIGNADLICFINWNCRSISFA